jgi:hypothetical protein
MKESVTTELLAGACGLDGDELTHQLLLENQRLLQRNEELRRANARGLWFWMFCMVAWLTSLLLIAK